MWKEIIQVFLVTSCFVGTDRVLTKKTKFQGIYYLLHFFHNIIMVFLTFPDVVHTFTDFHNLETYPANMNAALLCKSLHLYHCICYWRKFRMDDWLHHILMIGIALPIGMYFDTTPFLGYSLFFTTGLPGGIDYLLLFLNRNGWVSKRTEKEVNTRLNVWIRSPGCISHAAFVTAAMLSGETLDFWKRGLGFFPAVLTYWNGQYFMNQVVWDLAQRTSYQAY
jgi:hypothetical protein